MTSKRIRECEENALDSKKPKINNIDNDVETNEDISLDLCEPIKPVVERRLCPYLGTINRNVLDFDFEKLCCISLSNIRPYGCLVCGKYFQGRGKNTHAMIHALETQHYIFINLHDTKIYCLPDNYEVVDASLDDIKYHLNPTYTENSIKTLSTVAKYGKALDGTDYIPGCIGLNNLKKTGYFNVVIQVVDPVVRKLGELIRKIFNPNNFKGIVSPHEFIQAVGVASNKKFRIGYESDPLAFLTWLLDRLHRNLKNKKNKNCLQGKLCVSSSVLVNGSIDGTESYVNSEIVSNLILTLKVPPMPIFKDPFERNTIPQVPIFDLMQKFDGVTRQETTPGHFSRYSIWKLPQYIIVHINRFSKNNFFVEKNSTVVTFPVKNFDLKDYVHPDNKHENPVTRYDLVANIVHEGSPHDGYYKCHIYHSATNAWYEIENLRVTPILPQMVALSESYVQLYQRQDVLNDIST